MAEPTAIIIEVSINEKSLKKLLVSKFDHDTTNDTSSKPVNNKLNKFGYFFSKLLHQSELEQECFIFNYDKTLERCFIAYIVNYTMPEIPKEFAVVIQKLSELKTQQQADYAIIANLAGDILDGYAIEKTVKQLKVEQLPESAGTQLLDKLWSFNGNFQLSPAEALAKRNYYYKNFKNYYRRYVEWIEESLKPQRIANATKDNPYILFHCTHTTLGEYYTYDKKVFFLRFGANHPSQITHADPNTLRTVGTLWGVMADKDHVYVMRMAKDSPPKLIKQLGFETSNPDAKWEWCIVEGIDGATFDYVGDKYDTCNFRDKNHLYHGNRNLKEDNTNEQDNQFCCHFFYKVEQDKDSSD